MRQIILAVLLLFLPATVLAWNGKVIHVIDGDTFNAMHQGEEVTIRLYGIDCPEHDQPYGQKARRALEQMIGDEHVQIEKVDVGPYGRTIGLVNGGSVNAELVRQGFAWVYDRYCNKSFCSRWIKLEDRARGRSIGFWSQSNPTPPWEWRH